MSIRQSANAAIKSYILGDKSYQWEDIYITNEAIPACDINNKKILTPVFGANISEEDDMIVRAKQEHETLHALLTPRWDYKKWSLLKCEIINIIEDMRIEKAGAKINPIFGHDINRLRQSMFRSSNDKITSGVSGFKKPLDEAIGAMQMMEYNCPPAWTVSKEAQKYIDAAYHIVKEWRNIKDFDKPKGLDDVEAIAERVIKAFEQVKKEEMQEKQKQEQQEQNQEQQSGDQDNQDNQSGSSSNDKQDKKDKQDKQNKSKKDEKNSKSKKDNEENNESEENEDQQDQSGDESEQDDGDQENNEQSQGGESESGEEKKDKENKSGKKDSKKKKEQEETDNESESDTDGEEREFDETDENESDDSSETNELDYENEGDSDDDESESGSEENDGNEDNNSNKTSQNKSRDIGKINYENDNEKNLPEIDSNDVKKELEKDFSNDRFMERDLEEKIKKIFEKSHSITANYRPFTGNDIVVQGNENKKEFDEARNLISSQLGQLAMYTENALKALSKCHRFTNLEKGRLDNKKLPMIVKSLTTKLFYKQTKGLDLNVAITILIDESGSIGWRYKNLMTLAVAFSEVFYKLGIKFEVLGYTTVQGGNIPDGFDRNIGMKIIEHKNFGDNYQIVKYRLGSITTDECNVDGDSLMFAYNRIKREKANRRIMFVLSDGQPNQSNYGSNTLLLKHLKDVVSFIHKNQTEVYAFGIGTTEPEKFYGKDNFVYLARIEELGSKFFQRVKEILSSK